MSQWTKHDRFNDETNMETLIIPWFVEQNVHDYS